MPKFPVSFKRRPTAGDDAPLPSFRVIDRSELPPPRGAVVAPAASSSVSPVVTQPPPEDNLFADLKNNNRGSASSSNATHGTRSTDTSSRHSYASTAPSSAEAAMHDEAKVAAGSGTVQPPSVPPESTSSGWSLRKTGGRAFSFGAHRKKKTFNGGNHGAGTAPGVSQSELASSPLAMRPKTASTATATATVITTLDGDSSNTTAGKQQAQQQPDGQKRQPKSYITTQQHQQKSPQHQQQRPSMALRPPMTPSSPMANSAASVAGQAKLNHSPNRGYERPVSLANESETISRPMQQGSPLRISAPSATSRGRSPEHLSNESDIDDDTALLQQTIAASQFLAEPSLAVPVSRDNGLHSRGNSSSHSTTTTTTTPAKSQSRQSSAACVVMDDEPLFDTPRTRARNTLAAASHAAPALHSRSPQRASKIMTPAQFEQYRREKEQGGRRRGATDSSANGEAHGQDSASLRTGGAGHNSHDKDDDDDDDDDDAYADDDEDEAEKAREAARARRRQEARLAVYRQQMMKVTGQRPAMPPSAMSTPNLRLNGGTDDYNYDYDDDDDDDAHAEVPLAVLAAHGFPSSSGAKPRPVSMFGGARDARSARASVLGVGSSLSLAESANCDVGGNARLPPFARKLPHDPYGGGVRGSMAQPGGLVGVIVNEERNRALRRGGGGSGGMAGVVGNGDIGTPLPLPTGMMGPPGMTPGELQMSQQMQHFMQLQMQWMQMMAAHGPAMPMAANPMAAPMHGAMMSPAVGINHNHRHSMLPGGGAMDGFASLGVGPYGMSETNLHARSMTVGDMIPGRYTPSIAPSERSTVGLPGRYRPVSCVGAPIDLPTPPAPPLHDNRRNTMMAGALGGQASQFPRRFGPVGAGPSIAVVVDSDDAVSAPLTTLSSTNAPKLEINLSNDKDDDDESGWEQMKAKREKRRSMWKSRKSLGHDLGSFIS